ncbi:MAG: hypothetical protein JNK19_14575 [Tabrizicola sp.]|nr:hypothetical protein [Tabrizicola sp.]
MKVIHRSEALLMIEDRPRLIGIMMIAMALGFLVGSMAMFGAGLILGGVLMGLIGVGVPLLIGALMVRRVRLTFDRDAGRLTRVSRSVLGLSREDFALDRVDGAHVGISRDSEGTTYRMELRLQDPDQTVPFTTYYTSGSRPEQMAEAVNDWLSLRDGPVQPGTSGGNR